MRSEREMYDLILDVARGDERVRAVILNGSRANPNAPRDFFQDYDIVYVVTDVASFKSEPDWIKCFGEMMILQLPDDMGDPRPPDPASASYAYLMQFMDGTRIDLTLYPADRFAARSKDSESVLLLDKDGIISPLAPASDRDYIVQPPTRKQFDDCCNEFWWGSPYVAKGLWRGEIVYAKSMLEIVREQLLKMLNWYVGVKTEFQVNPGKYGKYFHRYLEPEKWEMLLRTYADAGYENNWRALFALGDLFRAVGVPVAEHFGYAYPRGEDERVTAHLRHVRSLPKDAEEMH